MKTRKVLSLLTVLILTAQCATLGVFADTTDEEPAQNEPSIIAEEASEIDANAPESIDEAESAEETTPEEPEGILTSGEEIPEEAEEDGPESNEILKGSLTPIIGIGDFESHRPHLDIAEITEAFTYTGKAIKPAVNVTFTRYIPYGGLDNYIPEDPTPIEFKEEVLPAVEGKDYTVAYKNNVNAGTATVTVTGKGQLCKGFKATGTFTISQAVFGEDILADDIEILAIPQKTTFKAQKPAPVVKWATGAKVSSSLYTVSYMDMGWDPEEQTQGVNENPTEVKSVTKPGAYKFIVAPKNKNYTGVIRGNLWVKNPWLQLSKAALTISPAKYVYTGSEIRPEFKVTMNKKPLEEGTHFEVQSIENNIEPGKATITLVGKGDIKGTLSGTFTIVSGKVMTNIATIETWADDYCYQKGGVSPLATVKDGDKVLTKGKDYTVAYKYNTVVTTAKTKTPTITVTFKGKYKGTATKTFHILPQNIRNTEITVKKSTSKSATYKKPVVTIKDTNGKALSTSDYKILTDTFTEPDENGMVFFKIKGLGYYNGETRVSYKWK